MNKLNQDIEAFAEYILDRYLYELRIGLIPLF